MTTRIQCPHCQAEFSVPENALGKSAKCAKCWQRFELTAGGPATESDATHAAPVPVETTVPVESTAVPVEASPAPVSIDSSDSIAAPTIQTIEPQGAVGSPMVQTQAEPRTARRRPSKPTKSSSTPWIIAGAASLVAVIAVVAVLLNQGGDPPVKGGGAPISLGRGDGSLVLHVGDAAQETLSLLVDGKPQSLTTDATQRLALPAGEHQLLLRRRGYEPVEHQITIAQGALADFTPTWKKIDAVQLANAAPTGTPGEWLQNVEVAQRRAKQNNADVLVLFIGWDWSEDSNRILTEGLASVPVQQAIGDNLELVVLDYPMTSAMGTQVEDPAHNKWMLEKYNINPNQLPVMLGLDANGQPFGMVSEVNGSSAELAQQITALKGWHSQRDTIIRNATTVPAALEAMEWLDQHQVLRFHRDIVLQSYQLARGVDPKNEAGTLEAFFEAMWKTEIHRAVESGGTQIPASLDNVLSQWHDAKRFKDANRGARMHLTAAIVALRLEDVEAGKRYAERSALYRASDENLAAAIKQLNQLLEHSGELGSGTGFVVADGYLLTNYHVVEGPGRIKVGFSDQDADIDARVIASDEKRDLALLRLQEPMGVPLPIARQAPGRGARVAAFGYPLGDAIGGGLKLTTGVISGLPDASTEDMFLLDIRVNPGNSGGPLCNSAGAVVGMVTARTLAGSDVDSYGMAIPAQTVETFLRRYIPRYESATPLDVSGGWDQVDAAVNRSVLRVLKVQ